MLGKRFKAIAISAVVFFALVGCGTTEGTEVISESPSMSSEPVTNTDAVPEIGSIDPDVEAQIRHAVEESHMPSLSVGVIVGDELVWAKSYGRTPAGVHTAYNTGSVSKTFTAVAILQLYERGLLELDADINDYLPFSIHHPDHPDSPITVRMLINHTSGLTRTTDDYNRFLLRDHAIQDAVRQYFDLDLHELSFDMLYERGEFFEAHLVPGGTLYSDDVWTRDLGSFEYSDISFGLLAYIVECVSGQSFEDYLDQNIFQPLEMDESSAEVKAVRDLLAYPYERIEGTYLQLAYIRDVPFYSLCKPYQLGCMLRNLISPVGQSPVPKELEDRLDGGYLRFPVYRHLAGSTGILSSVPDLAAYLITHMNEGRAPNGYQLLQPDTMALMHELAVDFAEGSIDTFPLLGFGLGWEVCADGIQGHIGASFGYGATMLYQETTQGNVGIILLRNWKWDLVTDNDRVTEYGIQYYLPLEPLLFEAGKNVE